MLLKRNEASTAANMAIQSAVLALQAAAEEQVGTKSILQVIQETVACEIQPAVSTMTAVPQHPRQKELQEDQTLPVSLLLCQSEFMTRCYVS